MWRGAVWSLVLQMLGVVLKFGSSVIFARLLGAQAFGTYTYAVNAGELLGNPSGLGASSSSLRFVPEYEAGGRWPALKGLLRWFRATPLVVGSVVGITAAGILLVLGPEDSSRTALMIALLAVPLFALVDVEVGLIRGSGAVFSAFFPPLVLQPLLVLAGVLGLYLVSGEAQPQQAVLITVAALALTILVQERLLRRALISKMPLEGVAATRETKMWLGVSLPLLLSGAVQLVFQRVDVLLVGALVGLKEAGIYAVAFRTAGLASILQTAVNATIAPRVSKLFWSGKHTELEQSILQGIRWIFLPSLAITVGLFFAGRPVLSLFGSEFEAGWATLVVYSVGQLISVGAGPVGWTLNLTGHHNLQVSVNIVSAVLTLIGYFVFIPRMGIVGAAVANACGVAVKNLWLNVLVRRKLGYRISVFRALRSR